MKKIGEYTARGVVDDRTQTMIPLFDGSFKTAYRVIEFQILSTIPSGASDAVGVLQTDGTDGASMTTPFWDLSENTQIGWAGNGFHAAADPRTFTSLVDPDNLIVENLFITAFCTNDGQQTNYFIRMEKYEISEWKGALAMVRERSQADAGP